MSDNTALNAAKYFSFLNDDRFLRCGSVNLQMSWRVEVKGIVIGFIRKVNHGSYRWIAYLPNGDKILNERSREFAGHAVLGGALQVLKDAK